MKEFLQKRKTGNDVFSVFYYKKRICIRHFEPGVEWKGLLVQNEKYRFSKNRIRLFAMEFNISEFTV